MDMDKPIIVIAEHGQGRLRPVTWEGLQVARQVQQFNRAPVRCILIGEEVEDLGKEMVQRTGLEVWAIQVSGLTSYQGEAYTAILHEVLSSQPAGFIIAGHTSQGWDYAPRLARRLALACLTAVTGLRVDKEGLVFQRPLYGGKIIAEIRPRTEGAVVTFQPGVFKEPETDRPGQGVLRLIKKDLPFSRTEWLGLKPSRDQNAGLAEAEVIVAAGRGIGKADNLQLIQRLAALFPRSAVAGSRPLCDLGWLGYSQQIGLTGATVSPKLYLACGISGAYQHLAGMRDSGFIVAINKDPQAAIFDFSDVCIVEDLKTFIPLLIEKGPAKKR